MTLQVVFRCTTQDGEWYESSKPYSIKKDELERLEAEQVPGSKGGAAHIFVRANVGDVVTFYTKAASDPQHEERTITDPSGWIEFPMWKSATYFGVEGPWHVDVNGEWVTEGVGVGLPEGNHVSTFLVVEEDIVVEQPIPPVVLPPASDQRIYQVVVRTFDGSGTLIAEAIAWQS